MPLRRRNPFSIPDDTSDDELGILDEQEQDELIHNLRTRANATNSQYIIAARLLLFLSAVLHLLNALTQNSQNQTFLVLLTLLIHLNLSLYLLPSRVRKYGIDIQLPSPLSFSLTYALSAVAPTLCLFIGHTWKTMLWWCIAPAMVYAVQVVKMSIYEANESISTLEGLKYRAPGA
ncbi:hypothetical protein AX14_000704 [Amanita brunnescens Koide BX004]|nr:hypothetical protein AX14_000704 [Amanita brunnescens Koide BX004]